MDTLCFYILWYPLVTVNQVLVEFVMVDMVFIPERLKEIRADHNLFYSCDIFQRDQKPNR